VVERKSRAYGVMEVLIEYICESYLPATSPPPGEMMAPPVELVPGEKSVSVQELRRESIGRTTAVFNLGARYAR
jgi:hypothetical protein